jgi:hypothetical protein
MCCVAAICWCVPPVSVPKVEGCHLVWASVSSIVLVGFQRKEGKPDTDATLGKGRCLSMARDTSGKQNRRVSGERRLTSTTC